MSLETSSALAAVSAVWLSAGTLNTGVVVSKGDMEKVMNQHQSNQFAQDVPFMGGDEDETKDGNRAGTGVFEPGNVHSQVNCRNICCSCLACSLLGPTWQAL